jgi:hypothetical protein
MLLADAGVPGALIPVFGGFGVAGLFLTAAVVSGGFWLVHGVTAPRARRVFLISTAVACLVAAPLVAFLGQPREFFGPPRLVEYTIAAAVLAVVGIIALVKFRKPAPPSKGHNNPIA